MEIDEQKLSTFMDWIGKGWLSWLTTWFALFFGVVVAGYAVSGLKNGPLKGLFITLGVFGDFLSDLRSFSPRRVFAMTRLAIMESSRSWVWISLVVLVVVLLFAAWYLDPNTTSPALLYLSFVMNWSNWLVLIMAVMLSTFSIPKEFKSYTIYTLVTKPVRSLEIVLGRFLGFLAVGTMQLAIMGIICYLFVVRLLNHTHTLAEADLRPVPADQAGTGDVRPILKGRTTLESNHRHPVTVYHDKANDQYSAAIDDDRGHTHTVTVDDAEGKKTYTVSRSEEMFQARVPIYGKLDFTDENGELKLDGKGISVGYEWEYRSYISGASKETAIWRFEKLRKEDFSEVLPIEMYISAFRTNKGQIKLPILGRIILRNPDTGLQAQSRSFRVKEYQTDLHEIPLTNLAGTTGDDKLDVFEDLVSKDGELEVIIECADGGQYFGMARADLYLRAQEASFTANFFKGYVGLWFQMALVTGIGVLCSTFLNGPVAMLSTFAIIVAGLFHSFMDDVAFNDKLSGGGPTEAILRTFRGSSIGEELSTAEFGNRLTKYTDTFVVRPMLSVLASLIPDLKEFNNTDHVAYGYNISWELIFIHGSKLAAYVVPIMLLSYLFLKVREVAK